jgi:putative Ca2+/H+ antiporter (TMEM165/GDT1 family)
MSLFLQVLGMVFIAELGDKTQFLMIAMASKYKIRDILIGVGAAICVLNLLAIAVGTLLGGFLPTSIISLVAGVAFLCFAYMAIGGDDEEEELKSSSKGKKGAIITIFGTFFLAELGDKTQLTALTLAADSSSGGFDVTNLIWVFLGSSLALFAADVLGLVIGYFLGKTLPSSVFAWISFGIFAVFGTIKLIGGFEGVLAPLESAKLLAIVFTSTLCIAFAALTFIKVIRANKKTE